MLSRLRPLRRPCRSARGVRLSGTRQPTSKKGGKPGTLVADLIQQGAQALNDAELTELLVGKSTWIRNTVSGGLFRTLWSKEGQRALWNVNPSDPQPAHVGDAARDAYLGLSTSYTIKGGKVVESFGNTPVELTIYKISTPSWTASDAKELEAGAKYLAPAAMNSVSRITRSRQCRST
jgi:hypothetical protein